MPVFLNWVLAWCMPIFYYWLTVDIFVNASGKFQKNSSEIFAHNGSTFERIHMYFLKWDYFESYWEVSHIQIVGFSTEAVNPIKSNYKDQIYWAKHSGWLFQPPEVRQGKGTGEITWLSRLWSWALGEESGEESGRSAVSGGAKVSSQTVTSSLRFTFSKDCRKYQGLPWWYQGFARHNVALAPTEPTSS